MGLIREGDVFNLAKMVVSLLHQDLECRMQKLMYKKLKVMQPRIKKKSEFPTLE